MQILYYIAFQNQDINSESVLSAKAVTAIMDHCDGSGAYQSMVSMPKHCGGSGEDIFGWVLCDAPILLSCLWELGINY